MIPPAPFYSLGEHFAVDLPGARALFTTRRGGVSSGPYASLNLGLNTEDDPRRVQENHARLGGRIGAAPAALRQVHGTRIHLRTELSEVGLPEADGQVSTQPGVAPMVLVADCLPVVVAGEGGVAVLHAGWRGLAGGIIAAGVRALRAAGAIGDLHAAIGPGAGGCCYEVGEAVHAAFSGYGPEVHRGANLDLNAAARADLLGAGVVKVHDLAACTLCGDPELFFSHRRAAGLTGRQAGVAWLR